MASQNSAMDTKPTALPRPYPRVKPRTKPRPNQPEKDLIGNSIVKSDPYTLEEFAKHFQLPQTVRVYAGHYGITEQRVSMSEGEELILFFIKSSKVVKATTRNKSETYYLPLNSLLQFSPYYQTSSADSPDDGTSCTTVRDLIQRKEGLPKVMKVLKSHSGTSQESSVIEGAVIFPKEVSGRGRNAVLKCFNKNGRKLKLGLSCTGQFSTDPCDVKMYLLEYIEHINEFPAPLLMFSEKEQSKKLLQVYSSTVLVLEAPQSLRSYICTTDIFGKSDYPMIELPMIMPVQVQRIERPGLKMEPIYSKVQHTYENFNTSLIKTNMYPAENQKAMKVQQQFYEEVKKDDESTHCYDLECPEAIYEPIPGEIDAVIKPPAMQYYHQQASDYVPVVPVVLNRRSPLSPSSLTTDQTSAVPSNASVTSPNPPMVTSPTPENNIAYLKKMDLDSILQLLSDMNLTEYKDCFKREQVDGELLADLNLEELEDLGVTKKIHQKRLMKLIDGSSSAKKYEGGMYSTLS